MGSEMCIRDRAILVQVLLLYSTTYLRQSMPVTNTLHYPVEAMDGAYEVYPLLMALYDKQVGKGMMRQMIIISNHGRVLMHEVIVYLQKYFTAQVCSIDAYIQVLSAGGLSKKAAKKRYAQVDNLLLMAHMQLEFHEFKGFGIMMYGPEKEKEQIRVFQVSKVMVDELCRVYADEDPVGQ